MSIFITATGTNVGKTLLSSAIMAKYAYSHSLYYWKPIQTGSTEESDSQIVSLFSRAGGHIFPNYLNFAFPASPDYAASRENREIHREDLIQETCRLLRDIRQKNSHLVVELAGGTLVPLNHGFQNVHYIQELQLPVLIAISCNLGTINHSLMTWESLVNRNIPILGFVAWGNKDTDMDIWESSKKSIESITGIPCLGEYIFHTHFAPENFYNWATHSFDPDRRIIEKIENSF